MGDGAHGRVTGRMGGCRRGGVTAVTGPQHAPIRGVQAGLMRSGGIRWETGEIRWEIRQIRWEAKPGGVERAKHAGQGAPPRR